MTAPTSIGSTWLAQDDWRTDNELATRFINENERKLRYVIQWGKWLVWTGKQWQADTGDTLVLRLARAFSNGLWDSFGLVASTGLDRDDLNKVRSFCKAANRDGGIRAYLNLARADERIAISVDQLNANPQLLNLQNGTFDFDTGELYQHSQDDLLSQIANVSFDESAKCTRWLDALSLIFAKDAELVRYVQQLLGYSITGDTGEHILPIAHGNGCNGKSTVWNTVLGLLGDFGGLANETLLMGHKDSHPTEKAFLYQKRFVPISEPEQSAQLREARVKELTGDSTITARRMNEDFWSFKRTHTFWLSTNHLPKIKGSDDGIWRRVKLIPFSVDLRTVTTPIPNLENILIADEGPGILNWLIEGYRDYRLNGFIEPVCIKTATSEYRDQEDELTLFIAECCVVTNRAEATGTALFDSYHRFGGKQSRTAFGKALGERFERDIPASGSFRKQTIYRGIGLPVSRENEGENESTF